MEIELLKIFEGSNTNNKIFEVEIGKGTQAVEFGNGNLRNEKDYEGLSNSELLKYIKNEELPADNLGQFLNYLVENKYFVQFTLIRNWL